MKGSIEREVERLLVDNYQKYYRAAFTYVKNEQDALDIVQESAYKAMKECRKLKDKSLADTWIYRIVINTSLDLLRKSQRDASWSEEYLETKEGICEQGFVDVDIMDTLSRLEEKDRAVIVLRFFEDFKLEQIAEATGERVSTVKSRLYRALKKLKLEIEV